MIFFALYASYASYTHLRGCNSWKAHCGHTRRKEKMTHPKKSQRPMLKGMYTQPFVWSAGQLLKMAFDHDVVVSMVIAVKISET